MQPQELGLDHDVAVDALTGAARIRVPLSVSPGRDGFEPQLTLAYSSSGQNSSFGVGWSLEGVPSVSADLRRRYPTYDSSQCFRLTGVGELVPDGPGSDADRGTFRVRRYLGREHTHLRIERWTDKGTGATHWRTRDASDVLTIFGARPDGLSRVADPADPARVLAWLADLQVDPVGNAIAFEYAAENLDGVDTSTSFERSRRLASLPQRYPKRIRYGNRLPVDPAGVIPKGQDWCFDVVFDYGDHPGPGPPQEEPSGTWPARVDPFSTFRPGLTSGRTGSAAGCSCSIASKPSAPLPSPSPTTRSSTARTRRARPSSRSGRPVPQRPAGVTADAACAHVPVLAAEAGWSVRAGGSGGDAQHSPSGVSVATAQKRRLRVRRGCPGWVVGLRRGARTRPARPQCPFLLAKQ